MTDFFFICSIKSPQCADKCSKKIFFDSDFPSPCFHVPKASNFTSGGVQNRDTKNRRLGTIVTSIQDSKPREKQISQSFSYCELINLLRNGTKVRCLWENKKTSEKSVFHELGVLNWRHNRSHSPVFGLAVLYPTESEIWCFWYIKTRERKIAMEKNFFAVLISTLGRFDRANKKNLSYTL